ncbi:hypothetical protein CesoFtcFv8_002067 [Champsocephalus esox]|uniref:Uncharacterized protein n=1 Tax=Champsocephalus esox TaxID=159716 RepID=A0AAN8D217_9TELE|nr:hypothetical protein CesoFtcFv8_002067 [Champsocephalus esox]
MTNSSKPRHLAPTLPLVFLPPLPYLTISTPLSFPSPSSPEGSLEVAPLNAEAGAEMHQVPVLRNSRMIGRDGMGESGLS